MILPSSCGFVCDTFTAPLEAQWGSAHALALKWFRVQALACQGARKHLKVTLNFGLNERPRPQGARKITRIR